MGLLKKVTGTLFGDPTRGFDQGINAQNKMYEQGRADLAPYRDFGGNYLATMRDFMAKGRPTADTVRNTPGYQFRLDEGRKSTVENPALAQGNFLSGNTLRALTEYGQNYASNEYDKELSRDDNQFAKLMQLIGVGSNAAGSSAGLAQNQGNSLAQLYAQRGQAEADMMQFPWKLGATAAGSFIGAGGKFG